MLSLSLNTYANDFYYVNYHWFGLFVFFSSNCCSSQLSILLLLYVWINALHLPAANYLFWMSLITEWLSQWAVFLKIQYINELYWTTQVLFIPFTYLFIYFLQHSNMTWCCSATKAREETLTKWGKAEQEKPQDPLIHFRLQKQREGKKDKDQHKTFMKCTILFSIFASSVMNVIINSRVCLHITITILPKSDIKNRRS